MKKTIRKPFTLIEILIVVIILGTLAAIVIPQFRSIAIDSEEKAIKTNLATLRISIETYITITKKFPNKCTDLTKTKTINGIKIEALLKEIPTNSANNKSNVTETTAAFGTIQNKKGWNYNKATGEIWADTTGHETF
ncbi:MAG: hypothetical protein COA79_22220 [Planctomycetota bacterium]|nr:MAG: hypothetical protein COA79_22220 [Planctomycetota bacterium]